MSTDRTGQDDRTSPFDFHQLRLACQISEMREELRRLAQDTDALKGSIEHEVAGVRARIGALTPDELADAAKVAPILWEILGRMFEIRDQARRLDTGLGTPDAGPSEQPAPTAAADQPAAPPANGDGDGDGDENENEDDETLSGVGGLWRGLSLRAPALLRRQPRARPVVGSDPADTEPTDDVPTAPLPPRGGRAAPRPVSDPRDGLSGAVGADADEVARDPRRPPSIASRLVTPTILPPGPRDAVPSRPAVGSVPGGASAPTEAAPPARIDAQARPDQAQAGSDPAAPRDRWPIGSDADPRAAAVTGPATPLGAAPPAGPPPRPAVVRRAAAATPTADAASPAGPPPAADTPSPLAPVRVPAVPAGVRRNGTEVAAGVLPAAVAAMPPGSMVPRTPRAVTTAGATNWLKPRGGG